MELVKPDLNLLIKHLEAERRSLNRMIKRAETDGDHLIVYHHKQALGQLDSHLDTLRCIKDPLHFRKLDLMWRIDYLKQLNLKGGSKDFKIYLNKKNLNAIGELKEQLKDLNARELPESYKETDHIGEALIALYEKRNRYFKLDLWNDENSTLVFRIKRKLLHVSFNLENMITEWDEEPEMWLADRKPDIFRAVGFQFDAKGKKYICTHTMAGSEDIRAVKMWLSHFLLDYLHMYSHSNHIRLIYG